MKRGNERKKKKCKKELRQANEGVIERKVMNERNENKKEKGV